MLEIHPSINHDFVVVDIVVSVFMLLTTLCVGLRLFHRCTHGGMNTGWDDWTILGAFGFALSGFVILIILSLQNIGIGDYHIGLSAELEKYVIDTVSTSCSSSTSARAITCDFAKTW